MGRFACLVGTNLVPMHSNLEVGVGEEECLVHTVMHLCLISKNGCIMDTFCVTVMRNQRKSSTDVVF